MAQVPDFAKAREPITLTGYLDPIYTTRVSSSDIEAIAKDLYGLQAMTPVAININVIYSPNDIPAFEAASREVSRVMIEAAKKLVDMRMLVYRLSIDVQRDHRHRFTSEIYGAYQRHLQKRFDTLLGLFLGNSPEGMPGFNEQLTQAMEKCFTTSCLQDIADAQLDLAEFGRSINRRIDLNSSLIWKGTAKGFRSRIVIDTVQQTYDTILKANKKVSAYLKVLRIAATPFVAAATTTTVADIEYARFIASPMLTRYKISVGKGGTRYQVIQQPTDPVISAEESRGSNSIFPLQLEFISKLNQKIRALSGSVQTSYETRLNLLKAEITLGKVDAPALAKLDEALQKALNSGMQIAGRNDFNGYLGGVNDSLRVYAVMRRKIHLRGADDQGNIFSDVAHLRTPSARLIRFWAWNRSIWAVPVSIPNTSFHMLYVALNLEEMVKQSSPDVSNNLNFRVYMDKIYATRKTRAT